MKTLKFRFNQNRREHSALRRKFCNLCVYTGFLTLFVCLISLTLSAEDVETEKDVSVPNSSETQTTENTAPDTEAPVEMSKEIITGTANRMESYEQEGITILIDEAKTVRRNEQGIEIGFLNADKITLKRDTETDQTKEIVAEGNVEIRDQDIFATCDHAIMNNLTSTIILKENVVVLQNKDRLETKYFTFNRITGKQTAEGDVKFKVTVTQAAPVTPETDENTEGEEGEAGDTGEEKTSVDAPQQTEGAPEKEADTDTDAVEGDAAPKPEADESESGEQSPPTDADSEGKTDPEPENADDADSDTETEEESENN